MKVRQSKDARNCAPSYARVVTVATQIATGDAPAQGKDRGKQHSQEFRLVDGQQQSAAEWP